MSEINYQALREAAQNYQSTLAWYEAITDTRCAGHQPVSGQRDGFHPVH